MATVNIAGSAGPYVYEPLPMLSNWTDVGGNYIFARQQSNGWYLLYVGQCDSFRKRMPTHERWAEAVRLGATHVLAHVNQNDSLRLLEERDLIRRYAPELNVQHRAA